MDKFISPQQQKRASGVFQGLWEAVASPSAVAAANARKDKKKEKAEVGFDRGVNLMDENNDEDDFDFEATITPSKSSKFTVLSPDRSPRLPEKKDLDLSITASPSAFLTTQRDNGLYTPSIKEDEKESEDSSDDWNW